MIINDFYDVHLLIHDIDLFDSGCADKIKCCIYESVVDSVPVCKITFNSSPDFLNDYPIVDGTKVTIQIKSDIFEINDQYVFRVMKFSALPFGNMFSFAIEAVVDFYELFRAPNKYSANNNSSEIFNSVMKNNNLIGSIHQTQDKQLWVPSEANLGQWLSYIAAHGWSSQQSGFYWFMNKNKNLFYLDIDKLIHESKNIIKFYYGDTESKDIDDKIVRYKNIIIKTNPGEENLFNRGYDGESHHFDLMSYTTKQTNANKVRATSEIVNINKELSNGLGKSLLQLDVGNHHKNYFIAEMQNRRVLSTYSTYVDLSCELFRPIKLSQVCTIDATSTSREDGEIKPLKIKYIISKIITNISSSTVNMDVELCTQGYNGLSTESY